ncbi:YdcF family protein [Brevibacillus ginsengisoli]|uniref:YdcF family protein n=1 Tax=Brevibacillus ginsengisoli TaxID=363854 RepID=UPI003CF9CBEF
MLKAKRHNTWIRALLLIAVAGLIWSAYVVQHIWKVAHSAVPHKADVAIVLGAAVWGDQPSPGLKERLNKSLWLYQQKFVPKILVSGGLGNGKPISEAAAMKQYLLAKGVPEEAILIEDQSHDTYQNLLNSKQIMERHQLQTALIVSHEFHLARAVDIARTLQMKADPVLVDSQVLSIPYYYAREVLAYTYWQFNKTIKGTLQADNSLQGAFYVFQLIAYRKAD